MVSSITASHSLLGMVSNFFSSWQHMSKYFIAPSDSDVNLLTSYSRSRRSKSTSGLPVVNQSVLGPRLEDRHHGAYMYRKSCCDVRDDAEGFSVTRFPESHFSPGVEWKAVFPGVFGGVCSGLVPSWCRSIPSRSMNTSTC